MSKKTDPFQRLHAWIENGDDALEIEMQDELDDAESPELPQDKAGTRKKKKKKQNPARAQRRLDGWYRVIALTVCLALMGALVFAALRLPKFGGADTLTDSEVSAFYVENALEETGAVNIVTGIILDYRGFDTLGESHVLFIAVCTVLLLLSIRGDRDADQKLREDAYDRHFEPQDDEILQCAARLLTPLVLVFGLYIIANGHLSPGGGFSGGAILGAGLILYQNAFGYQKTETFFTFRTFKFVSLFALLFYSLAKGYHFFTGANKIDSGISVGTVGNILSGGLLLPLNFVVGCVVACTMYALYTMFRRGDF
ncbi:MAG: hypothetical protein IJ662_11660 [Clostridia bacterium]|nr:hypothetical protein [Clostridia bacterium]